jgi:hypothetical protein
MYGAGINTFSATPGGIVPFVYLYGQSRHYQTANGLSVWVRRGGALAAIVTQISPRHYRVYRRRR